MDVTSLRRLLLAPIGAGRRLHKLEEGQRAASNQRPFLFTVAFACVIALVISPQVYTEALFLTGLALTLLSTLPGALLPWDRYAELLYWVIPLAQFAAVAGLRAGGGEFLTGLSLIAVFPVIWLGWFKQTSVVVHVVTFTAALVIVWLPVFVEDQPLSPRGLAAPLLIPVILLVVGLFSANVSRSVDANQYDLEAMERDLRVAAAESQRRATLLNTVIETVPAGVVVVDADGNDLMRNSYQRMLHPLGIPDDVADPREDQLLVFHGDKTTPVPAAERPVRRAIDGESFTSQLIWLGDPHHGRALSVSANSLKDPSGASAGSVIVFNDVTEHVEALEAKDHFLQSVTHELRTPLTSILGYIDLALEEAASVTDDAALSAHLLVAERNASRLLNLVSDLLATATRPTLALRQADLAEVVRSSLASARLQAQSAGVILIDEAPAALPGLFDAERMCQVLDNLISNAIKYSSHGDSVTAQAWADGESLGVRIADTGRGISEEDHRQLFDKFFRAVNVRESAIPGLGLGLAITKTIIDAHRGSVSVESAPGQGTAFTLTIPGSGAVGEGTVQ